MKLNILLSVLFITYYSYNVSGQYIIAGSHNVNDYFYDFIPDSVVYSVDPGNAPYSTYSSDKDSTLIDINGDNINDIRITTEYSNGYQWYQRFYCKIDPLNNNSIAISHFDSCFTYMLPPVFKYVTPVANAFDNNDTINKNSVWIDTTACIAYHDNDANFIDCYGNPFASNAKYAGVKVLIPNDTLYGWIKIIAPKYDSLVMYEYACNLFSTGIRNTEGKISLSIYPNPAKGKFVIKNQNAEILNITIFNIAGENVFHLTTASPDIKIDLSGKPEGVYMLNAFSENINITEKIIIE